MWGRKRADCFGPGALSNRESAQRDFSLVIRWTENTGSARAGVMRGAHICGNPVAFLIRRQSTAALPGVREDALGVTGRAPLVPSEGDSAGLGGIGCLLWWV